MENRAGKYILVAGRGYRAFEPNRLQDVKIEIDEDMLNLLGEASRLLGKLDGVSQKVPNINLFISSYVRKEALMSSQIEGTQASLVDVLDPSIEGNSNADVEEVVNYTRALNYAIERLKSYPLCNSMLKEIHLQLLSGVRGEDKEPGEFRRSQNWIGGAGCNLNTARYVPPTVEMMIEAMSDLEKFINDDFDNINPLVKVALIHYQFETIHPFLDRNGRIGRMLIVLFLIDKKIINYPIFYISYFLKKNRVEYYDRLAEVRAKGNFEQWIKFFLSAVIETCEDSINTIEKLSELDEKNALIIESGSKSVKLVYSYILQNPIIEINKTAKDLGFAFSTIASAVKELCSLGVLVENTAQRRNRTFSYEKYLQILGKDTESL